VFIVHSMGGLVVKKVVPIFAPPTLLEQPGNGARRTFLDRTVAITWR
jgi:hypothetical protein